MVNIDNLQCRSTYNYMLNVLAFLGKVFKSKRSIIYNYSTASESMYTHKLKYNGSRGSHTSLFGPISKIKDATVGVRCIQPPDIFPLNL